MKELTFEKAYGKYAKLLFFLTRKMNLNQEDSEEIVQEAFIRLFKQKPPVSEEKIKSFLVVTVKNLAIDLIRKTTRSSNRLESYLNFHIPENEQNNSNKTNLQIVSFIVEEMGKKKGGEPFKLFYGEGLPSKAIAEKLNVPDGTVRSRISLFKKSHEDEIRDKLETMDIEDIGRNDD